MPTSQTSTLRIDRLDPEKTKLPKRVLVEYVYEAFVEPARVGGGPPLKSIGQAKELDECLDLIKEAIDSKEAQSGLVDDAKLESFTWEEPSDVAQLEAITILPTIRLPAALSSGPPSKSNNRVRELVPHLREEAVDPDHHGYQLAILGKMYDNWVDFVCWGRTNKQAYRRAIWFGDLIEEYAWYFTMSGAHRIINQGHKTRLTKKIGENIIYGYPVECFIRTEKITRVSEKTLEQIIIQVGISDS